MFLSGDRSCGWGLFIALLHLVRWGLLVWMIAPHEYRAGEQLFGVGSG